MTNYMDTNFNNNIQYIHSHMEKPTVSSDFFIALDGEKNHSEKKRHELKACLSSDMSCGISLHYSFMTMYYMCLK